MTLCLSYCSLIPSHHPPPIFHFLKYFSHVDKRLKGGGGFAIIIPPVYLSNTPHPPISFQFALFFKYNGAEWCLSIGVRGRGKFEMR